MIFNLSKTRWSLLFACLCMFALGLGDNIRGPLFPELINFFQLKNSTGSLSFALSSTFALLGTICSAFWLRRIHLDRLLAWSMIFMGLGLCLMGLSSSFAFFLLGTVFFGFSLGTTGVSQNLLIAENVESARQTKALSGLHGLYGLSSLLAPYLASRSPGFFGSLSGAEGGILSTWKSSFFVVSACCVLVLLLILLTRSTPAFADTKIVKSDMTMKTDFKAKVWISIFFASYVGAEILVSTRLALYMRTYFDMNLTESSNYVIYFFIFMLIGRAFFTFRGLNYSLKSQMNVSLVGSLIALVMGLWVHPFFLTLVGLAMAPFYPMAISYISDITGYRKRQYLTFVMAMQGVWVISMHLGVGYLTDSFGLFYAFGVGIILLLLSIICLNTHPQPTKS